MNNISDEELLALQAAHVEVTTWQAPSFLET